MNVDIEVWNMNVWYGSLLSHCRDLPMNPFQVSKSSYENLWRGRSIFAKYGVFFMFATGNYFHPFFFCM